MANVIASIFCVKARSFDASSESRVREAENENRKKNEMFEIAIETNSQL